MFLEKNAQYISFFHGRNNPNEDMDSWGSEGPILGPIQISWTYGTIKLHYSPDWDDFYFLNIDKENQLIRIGDIYYGDFEIWNDNDPLLESSMKNGRKLVALSEFKKLNEDEKK